MDIEREIASWKAAIAAKSGLPVDAVQELEDHLRDEMAELGQAGLSDEEALLIGLRRMGESMPLASELAQVHCDRLWKQLNAAETDVAKPPKRELLWVIAAAFVAALLSKTPLLFGFNMQDNAGMAVYMRNAAFFVIPVLVVGCFALRRFPSRLFSGLSMLFLVALAAVNLYPFTEGSNSEALVALHLPILLWLAFGLAYTGGEWRSVRPTWDFIRFTGEFVVYSAVLGLGGIVFIGLTIVFFKAIGLPAESFIAEYIGMSGLFAMPVVAAYLVEKKRSAIENIAPVLARVFIPLFLAMILVFLCVMFTRLAILWQDRNLLIAIDLLLMLVTGMALYDLSARDIEKDNSFTGVDLMTLLLIIAVLVIDVLALSGIVARLSQFGFSPNKTAALGENVLLLGNLAGLAYSYIRLARGRGNRRSMLRWQVWCMPAYFIWMLIVVFALPPLYRFM